MADDLQALMTRLKELPPGTMLTVLIPQGQIANVAGLLVQTNETFHIPGALFTAPALTAPPPQGDAPADTVPQQERYMLVAANLNIRAEPNKNATLLGMLKAGDKVAVKGDAVGDYVALSAQPGYVLASGLTAV